jgi:hypothetical protein
MRSFNEPWEPEDIFERADAEAWRERRAKLLERSAQIAAQHAEAEAKTRESARLFSLQANADQIRRDYREAGVEPVAVDAAGLPFVSLSMLLKNGWTIADGIDGARELVRPPAAPKRRTRADYDQNT